jgi:hypothetical protein
MTDYHHIKLPRRVLRTSRCEFLFSREPQSQSYVDTERMVRFMSKLIGMMGLRGHQHRIAIAYEYISLQKTQPAWCDQYNMSDPRINMVLNCPIDLKYSKAFFTGGDIEAASASHITSYIWLDSQFKQEMSTIECICGKPDDECISGC